MRSVAVLLLLCVTIAASAGERELPAAAIRKVLDDQVAAWNEGKLGEFMEGYWKSDQLTFFADAKVTTGWQATLDRYTKKYGKNKRTMGKLAFSELTIKLLTPDAALVTGRWRLTLESESPSGLFTLILQKQKPGWRIVHDHTSG